MTSAPRKNALLVGLRAAGALVQQRPGLTLVLLGAIAAGAWWGYGFWALRQARAAALAAVAEFDFDEARRQWKRCLELAPSNPELHLLAAQTARRDGDLEAAGNLLFQYEQLVGKSTPHSELEYLLLQAQRGHVHDVVKELIDKLEIRHPASEQIMESLAAGCARLYQLDRTAFWLKELADKSPKNAIGRLLRAQTDGTLGRRERRFETLSQLVADYPAYLPARVYLAQTLMEERRYDEALEHFDYVSRRQGGHVTALLGIAQCADHLERSDEARRVLDQLVAQHPDRSDVLLESARIAIRERRFADAEPLLRRALESSPRDPAVHQQLSLCLNQLGKLEESAKYREQAQSLEADLIRLEKAVDASVRSPNDPTPRLEAAQICLRNGEKDEALRWLLGALEANPRNPSVHSALATYYAAERNHEKADYHRQRALGPKR